MKRLVCIITLVAGSCGPSSYELYDAAKCYGRLAQIDSTTRVLYAARVCWADGKSPV